MVRQMVHNEYMNNAPLTPTETAALLLVLERAANRGLADDAEWFAVPPLPLGTDWVAAHALSEELDPREGPRAPGRALSMFLNGTRLARHGI